MAINLSFLGAVAGAAQGYSDRVDSLRDELKDNKRRQREWLATYGNKALDESNKQQDTITNALDDLQARGLKVPDAIQLLQKHGAGAVLQLQKYVKDYEETNNTKVDEVLMNKLWTAAEDFTTEDRTFEDAVNTLFGSPKDGATAPVIQEVEDRNFFERIKYNMGDRYEDEYEDFLSDPTEGIGGKSIKELRAMSVSSPSMLGTDGSAVFDRSVLRGSESTSAERASWNDLKETILYNALESLDPSVADNIRLAPADTDTGVVSRNSDEQWNMLTSMNAPEAYKEAIAEATRNAAQGIDLGNNRAAWTAYGGQDALNAILNPKTIEELFEATGRDPSELQVFATDEEALEFFKRNDEEFVYVGTGSDKELIARPNNLPVTPDTETDDDDDPTVDAPELTVEEGTYNTDDLTLKVQPTVAPEGVPERPEPTYRGEKKRLLERPKNKEAIDDWDDQYGDKYNYDGTYKIVRPQGPRPEDINSQEYYEYELWDATYGDTHDPLTGYPLIKGLDKTLIPNSGETK